MASSLRQDVADAAGRDVETMGELRENGDKLSVIDAIAFAANITKHQAKNVFDDICVKWPQFVERCPSEKFPGKGQRETPQCDANTIAEIFMLHFGRGSRASSSVEAPADMEIEPVALPPFTMDDMLRRMIQEEVAKAVAGEWEVMHGMLKDVMEALEVLKGTQDLGA